MLISLRISDDPSDDFMPGPADQPELSSWCSGPMLDNIRVVFHPISERLTEDKPFDEYGKREVKDLEPFDSIPWRPFPSRFDYRVTNLELWCYMNSDQTMTFLCLLEEAHSGALVNMKTYEHVQSMWDAAADRSTQFEHAEINVPYNKTIRTYKAYRRPLLGWIQKIIQAKPFQSTFNGMPQGIIVPMAYAGNDSYTSLGPWTVGGIPRINERPPPGQGDEAFLKPNAKPLALILYADKDKLSTFGTA
ncbi:hypothetical protein PQX77_022306 [Marasmius sp. AFHP31]|nr:hypothetical protein PQX77_022306 [Marasmius sp. AFHP31]